MPRREVIIEYEYSQTSKIRDRHILIELVFTDADGKETRSVETRVPMPTEDHRPRIMDILRQKYRLQRDVPIIERHLNKLEARIL